jgi:hypothetical protein
MIRWHSLLQRHVAEHPVLNPLVSSHARKTNSTRAMPQRRTYFNKFLDAMEVCSSTEMGAPGASHLGTGDHGPKTDRSRLRSVPVQTGFRPAISLSSSASAQSPTHSSRSGGEVPRFRISGALPANRIFAPLRLQSVPEKPRRDGFRATAKIRRCQGKLAHSLAHFHSCSKQHALVAIIYEQQQRT